MNSKDTVKAIMKMRGHSYRTLAQKLGYVAQNGDVLPTGIANRLSGAQEMRVDTLIKLLEALDCELVIKSKTTDKQEWVISVDEKEK